MGGPLSRLLSDLVIENKIELKIRNHERWRHLWDWVRLIDDTLSGWDTAELFQELEEEGKLPIFDILISRTEIGFDTSVYRKSTHSNRYIHYTSAQAWKEKVACIKTLKKRAIEYCSNEKLLADEFSLLTDIFEQNGYPRQLTHRILHEKETQPKMLEIDFNKAFHVPYHPKAKRLYKIIEKQFDCTIIYKKTVTLGDQLKQKSKQKESRYKHNVVYSIPCKDCPIKYIGQTKKTVNMRMTQHDAMCKKKLRLNLTKLKSDKKDNGLAYHHIKTGHEFQFDKVKILAEEPNYWRRLIREGIEIRRDTNTANLKAGFEIDRCWDPFLDIQPHKNNPG